MRPCAKQYKMNFGFGELYPPELQYLTSDKKHHGQDFLTSIGIPVIASVDGIINFTGWKRGYGNCVIIKFWAGFALWKTTFRVILAHLSKISQKLVVGARISKWDEVGKSGDSGMATGHPHLHFECQQLTKGTWDPISPYFITGDKP